MASTGGPSWAERLAAVPQQHDKDCGICCVCAVLSASQLVLPDKFSVSENTETLYADLSRKFPHLLRGASTVELAEPLLESKCWDVSFHTSQTGLNPAHVSLPFYADVDVQEEDARIRDITDRFKAAGMSFFSSALSMDALCEHVAGGGMAIVLVDSRFLPHAALFLSMQPSYVGHFVLVFDYSFADNELHLMDPAGGGYALHFAALETCSPEALQTARDQHGTDLDVLLLQTRATDALS